MNTKLFTSLLVTTFFGFSLFAHNADSLQNGKAITSVNNTVSSPADNKIETKFPVAKKLTSPAIKLLTTVFEDEPVGLLHMELAHNTGLQVIKELNSIPATPEIIAHDVKKMIKPIEQFFDRIKAFSDILKPLLIESLEPVEGKNILLLNCFDSNITSAAFFEQNIKSKEQLVCMCNEFIIFFRDIKESLNPKAKDAYIALKKRIVEERKTGHNA